MTPHVFVDTNVLLDVLARREPFYASAARVWTLAERGRILASVSAISFNNVYYIVRKAKDAASAEQSLVLLRDIFTVQPVTAQVLHQAMDAQLQDFEDAIQYISAMRAEADALLTRNPDDFPQTEVPILTPAEFLAAHFAEED